MSPQDRRSVRSAAEAVDTSAFVRTYLVTGGRTRPRHLLSLDTVLEPDLGRPGPGLPAECEQILALCGRRRRSVTELAGTLGRPVTAVKILVSDLLDASALRVSVTTAYTTSSGSSAGPRPTRQLLEALSAGLKAKWPDADAFPTAV